MEIRSGIPNQDNNFPPLSSIPNPESLEYIPKWKHKQEVLSAMFDIEITSEQSLSYPWVKDEMYEKVKDSLDNGEYSTLDCMFEEELLSKQDLLERGIADYKDKALEILQSLRSIGRYTQAKRLFITTGILSEEEIY